MSVLSTLCTADCPVDFRIRMTCQHDSLAVTAPRLTTIEGGGPYAGLIRAQKEKHAEQNPALWLMHFRHASRTAVALKRGYI